MDTNARAGYSSLQEIPRIIKRNEQRLHANCKIELLKESSTSYHTKKHPESLPKSYRPRVQKLFDVNSRGVRDKEYAKVLRRIKSFERFASFKFTNLLEPEPTLKCNSTLNAIQPPLSKQICDLEEILNTLIENPIQSINEDDELRLKMIAYRKKLNLAVSIVKNNPEYKVLQELSIDHEDEINRLKEDYKRRAGLILKKEERLDEQIINKQKLLEEIKIRANDPESIEDEYRKKILKYKKKHEDRLNKTQVIIILINSLKYQY